VTTPEESRVVSDRGSTPLDSINLTKNEHDILTWWICRNELVQITKRQLGVQA